MPQRLSMWSSALVMVLAAACWGFATVITKSVLQAVPPLALLMLQLAVSTLFLWTIVLLQGVRLPQRADVFRVGAIGLLNPGLAYTLSLFGLTRTTASMSTLLWAAEPILILGLAWLILCERLSRPLIALSVLAIMGVLLVAGVDPRISAASSLLGNGLILMGVLCCALYTVLTRRTMTTLDPLLIVALQQTFAFAWAIVIWPIEWFRVPPLSLIAIDRTVWLWVIASGILYYALAFWFYIIGLKRLPASVAGLFLNCIPIFGVSGAYLFLQEQLNAIQWVGALLILVAVFSMLRFQQNATSTLQESTAAR